MDTSTVPKQEAKGNVSKELPQQSTEQSTEQVVYDDIPIMSRSKMENTFNKHEFILKNLLPMKKRMEEKYQERHNEYYLNVLMGKIKCYEDNSNNNIRYYECHDKVEEMVRNNYMRLYSECDVLNKKLDNCIHQCSIKSKTNEDFEECSLGGEGCFKKYKNKVFMLYKNMYEIILNPPKENK